MSVLRPLLVIAVLASPCVAQSTFIPVSDRRAHVYDDTRGLLYISTTSGNIQRYNVATQTLLTPFSAGT